MGSGMKPDEQHTKSKREMDAFDRLPQEVRDVLNEVRCELPSGQLLSFLRQGMTPADMCRVIRATEPREMNIP